MGDDERHSSGPKTVGLHIKAHPPTLTHTLSQVSIHYSKFQTNKTKPGIPYRSFVRTATEKWTIPFESKHSKNLLRPENSSLWSNPETLPRFNSHSRENFPFRIFYYLFVPRENVTHFLLLSLIFIYLCLFKGVYWMC